MDPPTITVQPMSMTVARGSDVIFSVIATSEDNVLTYQWLRNGEDIVSGRDSTFQLMDVNDVDEGVWSVEVTNSMMLLTTSSGAILTVSKSYSYA